MKYIVGKPFRSHLGAHQVGEELPEAVSFKNIETFVNTGMIYRVHDDDYSRLPARVSRSAISLREAKARLALTGSGEPQETPAQVQEVMDQIEAKKKSREKAHNAMVAARAKKTHVVTRPVEETLPKRVNKIDTIRKEAEEDSTEFDPEAIRTEKLEVLREMAKEREIPASGNKPELAQRIIDHEIAQVRKAKEKP